MFYFSFLFKPIEKLFLVVQGWIGYAGTHGPMFVSRLGFMKPGQT